MYKMGRYVTMIKDLIDFIVSCSQLFSNNGFGLRILQELGISLVSVFLVVNCFLITILY